MNLRGVGVIVLGTSLLVVPACRDDEALGDKFVPQDKPEEPPPHELGVPSPIEAGTKLRYIFTTSLRRNANGGGGLTTGEAQAAGHLCLSIDKVRDTETDEYKDKPETLVSSTVQVRGPSRSGEGGGTPELTFSDQNDGSATAAEVDALLSPLWLKRLTVPSKNPDFATASKLVFRTQLPPTPEEGLASLLFFDVRALAPKGWSGWEHNDNPEFKDARSFLRIILTRVAELGEYDEVHTTPPSNCEEFDATTCSRNGCTFAIPPGGNSAQCLSLFSLQLRWRETLDIGDTPLPPELDGPVVHYFEVKYDANGVLSHASETLKPEDPSVALPQVSKACGEKCLTAVIENYGSWADDDAAICRF